MPDIPITQLPETTAPASTDVLPIVNGTVTKKVQVANLLAAPTGSSLVGFLQSGTGAVARTVQGKIQEIVSVTDFAGVDTTGAADSLTGIRNAAASLTNGGILYFPPGKYKVTDSTPLTAGITVQGSGGVDFIDGSPVPSASGSFIYQATAGKAIFSIGAGGSNISIKDIALAPALVPTHSPLGDGRIGISMSANAGQSIWQINFERVLFYNLDYGIKVNDPGAPQTQDWSVAPVRVKQCWFNYPLYGVWINTNNADDWKYDQSIFFLPSGGRGVYLQRFGFQHFADCFAGGASVSNNKFIDIIGSGGNTGVDIITVENCQAETLTNSVALETSGTYTTWDITLTLKNNIFELGADVYLGNKVECVSIGNRYSCGVNIDSASVALHSSQDWFDTTTGAGHISFLTGGSATLVTYIPHSVFYDTNLGNKYKFGTLQPPTSTGAATFASDVSANTALSIANNATAKPFSNANNFSGLILIKESVGGATGLFLIGGNLTTTLVSQSQTSFTVTATTAGKTNVYINGSNAVEIENKQGSTNTYQVMALRLATAL